MLPPLPGPAQLRPPQACCQHDPVPSPPLLHGRLCTAHLARFAAVPLAYRARAHPADVRRQEHDGCRRPAPRPLPDLHRSLPRPHVHQGGRRADAQCAEQELVVLRRVDPQQHEVRHLRHSAQGSQDVRWLHGQLYLHARGHEARCRAVHCYVPPQGFPPLVHWRGHGRDGVHRGRVQHERSCLRVPAIPGCLRRGGGRV
mmetsp:Transcript_6368/g.19841  ORF Transcript_6368/g.19841 Transcript_6368/m.19841 type:complete len:200 (+) Transcript_6368:184-783(+)